MDLSNLDRFIYVWQAARELETSQEEIEELIENGRLQAALLPDGRVGVSMLGLRAVLPREETPEYRAVAHLSGLSISINEASRRYGVHTSTLTRWMQRGLLRCLERTPHRTFLDEADVAYCANRYLQHAGRGRRVF